MKNNILVDEKLKAIVKSVARRSYFKAIYSKAMGKLAGKLASEVNDFAYPMLIPGTCIYENVEAIAQYAYDNYAR